VDHQRRGNRDWGLGKKKFGSAALRRFRGVGSKKKGREVMAPKGNSGLFLTKNCRFVGHEENEEPNTESKKKGGDGFWLHRTLGTGAGRALRKGVTGPQKRRKNQDSWGGQLPLG